MPDVVSGRKKLKKQFKLNVMKKITITLLTLLVGNILCAQDTPKRLIAKKVALVGSAGYADSVRYDWSDTTGSSRSVDFRNYPEWLDAHFELGNYADRVYYAFPEDEKLFIFRSAKYDPERRIKGAGATLYHQSGSSQSFVNTGTVSLELDQQGRIKEAITSSGTNSGAKSTYHYQNNNVDTVENFVSHDGGSSWENSSKYVFNYNASDQIKQMTYQKGFQGDQWRNDYRLSYNYTGGDRAEAVREEWNSSGNGSWDTTRRRVFRSGISTDTVIFQEYIPSWGAFQIDDALVYTYHNGWLSSYERLDYYGQGGIDWKKRDSVSIQRQGKYVSKVTQYQWESGSTMGTGEYQPLFKNELTYDGSLLTEILFQKWDESQDDWVPSDFGFNAFFYYESIDEETRIANILTENNFQLYPNPATDRITINVETTIDHIRIVNIAGQVVFQNKMPLMTSKATIPVSQLSPGVYFLQMESNSATAVKTFTVR